MSKIQKRDPLSGRSKLAMPQGPVDRRELDALVVRPLVFAKAIGMRVSQLLQRFLIVKSESGWR